MPDSIHARRKIDGATALHIACIRGDLKVVEVLIAQHADPICTDLENRTPLFTAALAGHIALVEYLLETPASTGMEIPSLDGHTPLFAACWRGHLTVAKLLQQHGANIDHKDTQGRSMLVLAKQWRQNEVATWLQQDMGLNEAII
eukprot:c7062_g1_i2.p1 GENE.c7062_g1_i2~~c7062_g1_i2.p1  ORF type:complete len:145 (+),score=27.81 c7062_g1_i2:196-630(+)